MLNFKRGEKKMAKRSKKYQEAAALIEKGKAYPIDEAVALVKKTSKVNLMQVWMLYLN